MVKLMKFIMIKHVFLKEYELLALALALTWSLALTVALALTLALTRP